MLDEGKPENSKNEKRIFVFKDGTLTIREGEKKEESKFTVDPTKKPAQIDIKPEKNGYEWETHGIYELKETDKGTELIIAFAREGRDRPKDFKGEGENVVVVKLRRNKDK
jgi:uncharacterized protein (TIGR03067 family)